MMDIHTYIIIYKSTVRTKLNASVHIWYFYILCDIPGLCLTASGLGLILGLTLPWPG